MPLFRLFRIVAISLRFGLDEFILGHSRSSALTSLLRPLLAWRRFEEPRAVRLRLALEKLGPIFVKFGQMLSTRRDLIPLDIADELAKLQDQVPPFPAEDVLEVVFQSFGKAAHQVFAEFDPVPVASASVAQVHFATLPHPCPPPPAGEGDAVSPCERSVVGTPVAVKILRPGITPVIEKDLGLMGTAAWALEKLWSDGKRLKPREVVAEFAKHIHNELDLMLEAANCSQLHRNFSDGRLLRVPVVYWDYCREQVMVMERMDGTPISQVDRLREMGVDIPRLARDGVEIFFTQVFRDGFFHADMHPGNIQVGADGKYIALDFGIMGTLGETDKQYLARNFLAFFRRDYKEVALAHIESGWVPKDTPPDEFENAIRAVCEPVFDKPLKDISFGRTLLRLFQTSRRFGVEIQPQLVMLQKTLLNIEGLGRQLDPELDLWATAKPFLERWMSEQLGWRAWLRALKNETPHWGVLLPQIPRLLHEHLSRDESGEVATLREQVQGLSDKVLRLQWAVVIVLLLAIVVFLIRISV